MSFQRARDRSFTVSTGGGAADERGREIGGIADNGAVVATNASVRELRVREGERLRIDLPSVQSLQFRLPGKSTAAGAGGAAGASVGGASTRPAGAGAVPVSGVLSFEAVSAFVVRFALAGPGVRVELRPLRPGTVQAPLVDAGGPGAGLIVLQGALGEWIALGDPEVPTGLRSLNASAEPPAPAGTWVRVLRAGAADTDTDAGPGTPGNGMELRTGQRP